MYHAIYQAAPSIKTSLCAAFMGRLAREKFTCTRGLLLLCSFLWRVSDWWLQGNGKERFERGMSKSSSCSKLTVRVCLTLVVQLDAESVLYTSIDASHGNRDIKRCLTMHRSRNRVPVRTPVTSAEAFLRNARSISRLPCRKFRINDKSAS